MRLNEDQFKRFKARLAGLEQEYKSFEPHHRELAENILPRLGRWLLTDTNQGGKKNGKIIDNTGKLALRVLASGMMSGLTSPARPWFNLESPNPELMEVSSVKMWLDTVKKRMNVVLARSNVYDSLPRMYAELILFGQGPMALFDDMSSVVFSQTFTQGEYYIANDKKGRVNTFARNYRKTVSQVVEEFGLENCSDTVKNLYDRGSYDQWVDLHHIVEPNNGRDFQKADNINKPFRNVYYEQSSSSQVLKFSGFDEFPVFCPRWDLNSGDVYASACPAMDALGDVKQLQLHEKRSSEAVEKMVRPSMVADPTMRNKHKSLMPGGVTYSTFMNGKPGFQEAYQVNARINELEAKSSQIRERINQAFYADLFLMLANTDRRQITAREVEERHEEKLLMLGPVLERLNNELLDPLIARTFNIMWRAGLIPPPPQELAGMDMKIEYVSVLHQAQRSVGVSSIDRFMGFAGNVMQLNPESRHKVNFDQSIDNYGSMLGVSPGLIRSDDEAAALSKAEQQAAQQAQQLEGAASLAGMAKDLSQVSADDNSALTNALGAVQ
jgi:hypothetical protein